jgi:succinoglycan biosynthesis transport protein ExoP
VIDFNTIATEVSLIKSFSVARRVEDRFNLKNDPRFQPTPARWSPFSWISRIFSKTEAAKPNATIEQSEPSVGTAPQHNFTPEVLDVIQQVRTGINARRLATTYFIEISFSHSDRELSAKLANAVADSYLDEQIEARSQAAQRASSWLSNRVSELGVQLGASESALAEHRTKFNLSKQQDGTLADQQAVDINAQLVAARAQTVEKKAKYDQVRHTLDNGGGIEGVAAVMESASTAALRMQEATLTREEANLSTRYGPQHPAILKIRAEHADIKRQIKREIDRVVEMLKTDYELALRREQSLANSIRELTGGEHLDEQSIIRLRELERDAQSNRTLYETTLARFKEAEQQTSLQVSESRIVAPAFIPDYPSFPKKGIILIVAIFGGLMLGGAAIALVECLENGFTAADQIEQALDLPLLALVPMLNEMERRIDGRIVPISRYVALRPQSRFGESIRSARLMMRMSKDDSPPRLILVTSSISGEGKTTIAVSLAFSAATASKQRVLIIDCDLRAQSVSRQFNLLEKPGLTNCLTEEINGKEAIYRVGGSNLAILPAGTTNCNPPDLLGSERMRALLHMLRDSFDVIYMDAPPLLPVIDSALLSKLADKVVFVVRWRTTPRNIVIRASHMIDNSSEKISGVALNGINIDHLTSYDPYSTYNTNLYAAKS